MTRGAVRHAAGPRTDRPVGIGRPPWWLVAAALAVTVAVTVELLTTGALERLDSRVAGVTRSWALRDSAAYWPAWLVTQLGGRAFLLAALAVLVGYLAVRRNTLLPLIRVLVALALLTVVVYGFKFGAGRTAPGFGGSFFGQDGASYPSGHVANAVLMWGVARWQAVEYALPNPVQRVLWLASLLAPLAAGGVMVALHFHWLTDAVVGAAVGIVLLGVVHVLDATVLSRFVRARAGQPPA